MPTSLPALAFGGDYNPEQWPAEAHVEDRRLMREAGVDLVTLGVFSWAWLQPRAGAWEFGWLDEQMDELHAAGIKVDLATAAVADAPPPRDAPGDPGRAHAVARRASVLLPELARLPRARPGAVHPPGRALPRPPGA